MTSAVATLSGYTGRGRGGGLRSIQYGDLGDLRGPPSIRLAMSKLIKIVAAIAAALLPASHGTRRRWSRRKILGVVTRASVYQLDSGLPGGVQGAADPNFACAVRGFASLFPTRRLGGGALSVYLDGRPVVDVWTGWADRRGEVPWSADTGAMVFSATKGLASTVIHRLVDRGLLAYLNISRCPEFARDER